LREGEDILGQNVTHRYVYDHPARERIKTKSCRDVRVSKKWRKARKVMTLVLKQFRPEAWGWPCRGPFRPNAEPNTLGAQGAKNPSRYKKRTPGVWGKSKLPDERRVHAGEWHGYSKRKGRL